MIDSHPKKPRPLFSVLLGVTVLVHAGALPIADAQPYRGESPAKPANDALRRGEELRRKWNMDAAEAAFREATTLEPASLEAALGLARVARARIEYARAISLLDKAASEHPNSIAVLAEYGSIYLAAEGPEQARRFFESALRISSSDAPAIIGLAGVDLLARDYDSATRSLRLCLEREPQNSPAHAMLARALLEMNEESEAAEEAGRAIALDDYNSYSSDCLTRNNGACDYAGCAFPVSGSQQLRLLRTHPRVAPNFSTTQRYWRNSFQ
jgi:tetratricopeptide (TPR) repeat protein